MFESVQFPEFYLLYKNEEKNVNARSLTLKTKIKREEKKSGTCIIPLQMIFFQNISYPATFRRRQHAYLRIHTYAPTYTRVYTHSDGLLVIAIVRYLQIRITLKKNKILSK